MFTELVVGNYKGFGKRTAVPLAPLTLVFGRNSAGKSALVQALVALAQTADNMGIPRPWKPVVEFSGPLVDLGGFRNSVHRHEYDAEMVFGIASAVGGHSTGPNRWAGSYVSSAGYEFGLRLIPGEALPTMTGATLRVGGAEDFSLSFVPRTEPTVTSLFPRFSNGSDLELSQALIRLARVIAAGDEPDNFDAPISRAELDVLAAESVTDVAPRLHRLSMGRGGAPALDGFLPETTSITRGPRGDSLATTEARLLAEFIRQAVLGLRTDLGRVQYLGPMRAAPQRIQEVIPSSLRELGPDGAGLTGILAGNSRTVRKVNDWLGRLEVPYSASVERVGNERLPSTGEYFSLVLTDTRTGTPISARDLGYGISQLLPIVVGCVSPQASTLVIEQPELHLHPSLQAEIGQMLAEVATSEEPTQLIVETHSENLILRVQRMVRERRLASDQVAILYVGASRDVGSWVRTIRLLPNGELAEEWPGGFFTERLAEW